MSRSKQEHEERVLREVYSQIVDGYTPVVVEKERAWIKHFSFREQNLIDRAYSEEFDKIREKGLPTREEALENLKKEGLWTDEESDEIATVQKRIEGLRVGLGKALNPNHSSMIKNKIKIMSAEIAEKEKKKR